MTCQDWSGVLRIRLPSPPDSLTVRKPLRATRGCCWEVFWSTRQAQPLKLALQAVPELRRCPGCSAGFEREVKSSSWRRLSAAAKSGPASRAELQAPCPEAELGSGCRAVCISCVQTTWGGR